MKSHEPRLYFIATVLSLTFALMAVAQEGNPTLPAELTALDAQFQALKKERVILPFNLDLGRLNTSYVGGLNQAVAAEKTKGDLDATLALENEKQALITQPEFPEVDDPATPEVLKKLRATYRAEFARINAVKVANLSALSEPLGKRLVQMEKDLTITDRLEDAKKVRFYREALVLTPDPNASPAVLAANSSGFTNSLGMKFLPVKGTVVMFCIHETRRKDYAVFIEKNDNLAGWWKDPSFKEYKPTERPDDHPVDYVSWVDAVKFCDWLSQKEGKKYRLPTDEEWSIAVGLEKRERRGKGDTPESLSCKETTEYPWGGRFPPKTKDRAGNYRDTAWADKFAPEPGLPDYTDGYPTTAPVMSFKPNKAGLYDMGGNAIEWVEDYWNDKKISRVMRGGSYSFNDRNGMLSSWRAQGDPEYRWSIRDVGFRIVVEIK